MIGNILPDGYHIDIDGIDESDWAELLTQFADATIYQTWSYAAVLYGKTNLSHAVLKKDGYVVSIAQVGIKKIPIFRLGIANIHWGPLWRKKNCGHDINNLAIMINTLKYEYSVKRALLLRIWPNEIETPEKNGRLFWEEAGFIHNSEVRQYRTFKLRLTLPLEELRKNLDQKWRNRLNHAEKNNLRVIEGSSDDLYKTFLVLQEEMLNRKKYIPGVDYDEYRKIQLGLPEFLKMRIMICVNDGVPVSASICSAIGDTGIYLLGASGDKGMNLNGSNLLQWRMIEWLKARGCLWYDLGGIDQEVNPNVYHFKRGIAGKIGKDETHIGQFVSYTNIKTHLLNNILDLRMLVRGKLSELRKL